MTATRLIIICIRSWISKTQSKRAMKSTGTLFQYLVSIRQGQCRNEHSRGNKYPVQHQPSYNPHSQIYKDLSPYHVDVLASKGRLDSIGLLDCFPHCQKPKPQCESSCRTSQLEISYGCHRHCANEEQKLKKIHRWLVQSSLRTTETATLQDWTKMPVERVSGESGECGERRHRLLYWRQSSN